jgi:circadian clock protein KaiB
MSGGSSARSGAGARLRLKLYVAGEAPNSVAAISNLKAVLGEYELEVDLQLIDVLAEPQRALADRVLITPMLVRVAPAPECRIVGNLRDRKALLAALGLKEGAR